MNFTNCQTALVIAAHPDDEVLGAGGTMARMAQNGTAVYVVFAASGITARYADPNSHRDETEPALAQLKRDARAAADALGVKDIFFLGLPDNRLDTVSRMDISHLLAERISALKPDTVFTHHSGDYNWDHTIVYDATMMAARANPGDFFPKYIFTYEVLSSTERQAQTPQFMFCPNTFVDISQFVSAKKKALECYTGELRAYPHPRSALGIEYLARKRGVSACMEYAEAFCLIRNIIS
ncbi:PIG-L family deacetylase [bacterium]|nr:PIG-L family deacetylase [bacterium]